MTLLKKNIELTQDQIIWFLLFTIIIVAGVIRYSLVGVPFERDEGEYAYAGQLILKGIPPYKEVLNMKLPGIYYAYAFILSVFGQTHEAVHKALIAINSITTIFVFLLSKIFMSRSSALFSAACFVFLSLLGPLHGLFANAEHFVLLFAVPGLYYLLRGLSENSLFKLLFSGLLFGICFSMKQHGAVFCVLGAVYIIYFSFSSDSFCIGTFLRRLFLFSIGGVSVYVLISLVMVTQGVFDRFWFWTVEYARAYISQIPFSDASIYFYLSAKDILLSAPILWGVIVFGLFALLSQKISKHNKTCLFLLLLFSFLSICPGGFFRHHYFILLLPIASLIGGMAVNHLSDLLNANPKLSKFRFLLPVSIILCFVLSIYFQRDYLFFMSPSQVSRSIYGLNPFIESIPLAKFLRDNTEETDKIAILGSEPQIFFYSGRKSASAHIYMYPLMENHVFSLNMQEDFIREIEISNPKYLVYIGVYTSWDANRKSKNIISKWFNQYIKKTKLVGLMELFDDKTVCFWGDDVHWPSASHQYIAIFKRLSDKY